MTRQNLKKKQPVASERRDNTRAKISLMVSYGSAFDLQASAQMQNLGHGGVFIRTEHPMDLDSIVDLEFTIPETFRTIRARGKVTWAREDGDDHFPPGMGLSFIEISPVDQKVLSEYVDKLLREQHAPKSHS